MCDEWMPAIKLPLTPEQFRRLPRNPAYRYEYLDGEAYLSPRPKHYHAVLDLADFPERAEGPATLVRPVGDADWPWLAGLFAASFRAIQPFGSLDEATLTAASDQCLSRTQAGRDGPLIGPASCVAVHAGEVVGASLVTLIPKGDPCDSGSYRWHEPPPPDCIAERQGRPHLTWIFVLPFWAGQGIGSSLLETGVKALRGLGFESLLSTFVLGNDSSALWHWRNGFELLAFPGSHRLREGRRRR